MKSDTLHERQQLPGNEKIVQPRTSIFGAVLIFRAPPCIGSFFIWIQYPKGVNDSSSEKLVKPIPYL